MLTDDMSLSHTLTVGLYTFVKIAVGIVVTKPTSAPYKTTPMPCESLSAPRGIAPAVLA